MTDSLDDFTALLRALVMTENAPPPRDPGERWVAIACEAFRGWIDHRDRDNRTVPAGEFIELRRRLRAVERERDELRQLHANFPRLPARRS